MDQKINQPPVRSSFKLALILLGLAAVVFTLFKFGVLKTEETSATNESSQVVSNVDESGVPVVRIGVVTFQGYVPPQWFNKGFKANVESGFFKEYGFKVEFVLIDDVAASRSAFISGDIDILWTTIDSYPTEVQGLYDAGARVFLQADWSRGADAIAAYKDKGINTVADFKGKRVAYCPLSPSESFLRNTLESANMTMDDIIPIETASAISSGEMFRSENVDIAVVWSPDDSYCVKEAEDKGRNAYVITSTKTATNIISDVFLAKEDYIANNREMLVNLGEGWLKSAAEINSSESARIEAAEVLRTNLEGFGDLQNTLELMKKVRYCTIGDNLNFFGLNSDYNGVTGRDLYETMTNAYTSANVIKSDIPSWSEIVDKTIVADIAKRLKGGNNVAEGEKVFEKPTKELEKKQALSSKSVTVFFENGSDNLSPDSKSIITKEFEFIAKSNGGARIRVVGNTDATGNKQANIELSKRRARAVANFMIKNWKIDENNIIVVGNGSKNAEKDGVTGADENYRRTDFQLVAE